MNKKGFILLEVLLSLVILGTVFVVSIQAISSYVRTTSSASNINTATALAQTLITKINLNEFKTGINENKFDNENSNFSYRIDKTDISDSECQYEVVVKWNERGIEKNLKLTTSKLEYKN